MSTLVLGKDVHVTFTGDGHTLFAPGVLLDLGDGTYSMSLEPNAPTWVGQCLLCKAMRLDYSIDPGACGTLPCVVTKHGFRREYLCSGSVLLHHNWEALLAAYLVGGWDALKAIA